MSPFTLSEALAERLHALFTRAHYSAAGYVFDAQPYQVPEDAPLLAALEVLRTDDRRQALLLANLIQYFDLVPEAGPFPWWHRDLNYLSVPYLANFVCQSLSTDLEIYDALLAEVAADAAPEKLYVVETTLRTIRAQLAERREMLAPLVDQARAREVEVYAAEAAALAKIRSERLALEKAGAEKARKAAQDARKLSSEAKALGLDDPAEDGLSAKEKAKRTMLLKRAQKAAAEAKAAPVAASDPTAGMPDPNEDGISGKEKAKRTMLIKRALKKAAAAAPAATTAAAVDPTAGMPDPNEDGISGKEKAKRTMLIKRALKKAAEAAPAAAPPAAATPAADPTAGMPDPNEEGISSKEKAKRTMLIKRALKKAAGAAPAAAPSTAATPAADPTADMPDPNEEGISSKEKAKRTMMIKRAQRGA